MQTQMIDQSKQQLKSSARLQRGSAADARAIRVRIPYPTDTPAIALPRHLGLSQYLPYSPRWCPLRAPTAIHPGAEPTRIS
jgi:hypothetical protein